MRNRVGLLVVGVILVGQVVVKAAEPPPAVSPGRGDIGAVVESRCPTFSWGAVPGAESYELVVYQVGDEGEEAREVLQQSLPGSVLGWTPAMDQCLERGSQHAWSVRALGKGAASDWSAPSLFEVSAGPSEAEFEAALQIVKQYVTDFGAEFLADGADVAPDVAEGDGSSSVAHQAAAALPAPAAGDSDLMVNGAAVVTTATFFGAVTAVQRECPGALGLFSERYVDCGNGTVRDNNTGVYWLRDASCDELAGTDPAGRGDWDTAEAAAAALADGTCGLTDASQPGDWRQPSAKEFCSAWSGTGIQCPTSAAPDSLLLFPTPSPMINKPNPFVDAQASLYWSANRPIVGGLAWAANLDSANVGLIDRSITSYVWPVRFGE